MEQWKKILLSWRFWAIVIGVVKLHLPELQAGNVDLTLAFNILAEVLAGAGLIRTIDRHGEVSGQNPV